jgi:dihydrolipoamide dehydrogenase
MSINTYDLIVIGSGPGGEVGAIRASQLGLKVALVEKREHLGGTCLNVGCIPTKSLLESAKTLKKLKDIETFGFKIDNYTYDWTKIVERKNKIVAAQQKGLNFLMKKNKIDVFQGKASLISNSEVKIEKSKNSPQHLKSKHILLATGSEVSTLKFLTPNHKNIFTSDSIININKVPKSLAVIGGGYIGMEFASLFGTFGCQVTVIELLPEILPTEDIDTKAELIRQLKKQNVTIETNSKLTNASTDSKGCILSVEGKEDRIFECVLSSVGRKPMTRNIGLEKNSITFDKDFIKVNHNYQSSIDNIFAIGDIINTPALAHTASAEAIHAVEIIAGLSPAAIDYNKNPSAIYTIPEIASLGKKESELKISKQEYKVAKFPFSPMAKAKIENITEGFIKILYDPKYKEILGVHIIGHKASELISEFVLGQMLETTIDEIAHSIHPHPTLSETILETAHIGIGGALHL